MVSYTSSYNVVPGRISAYLDILQMLTGAGLILFMWSHMILVASVNLCPCRQKNSFQKQRNVYFLETQQNPQTYRHMALDDTGLHGNDYTDHGIYTYVDGLDQPSDHCG